MVYHVFTSSHKYRGTDTVPCLQEAYSTVAGYRKMDSPGMMDSPVMKDKTGDDGQCRDDRRGDGQDSPGMMDRTGDDRQG